MKKALLACSLIVSSVFLVQAQFQLGGTNINFGKVCGTISGKPACVNPSTGQWEVTTGNGKGVGGNYNTGVVGGNGTIGGVQFGATINSGSGAQAGMNQGAGSVLGLLALAQLIVVRLAPFLIGLALLAFFWFLILFIWKGKDSPDEQKKGRIGMAYSILALFVMVSVWGIIGVAGSILGIRQGGTMTGFKLPGE